MAERKERNKPEGAPKGHAIHRTEPDAPMEPRPGETLTEDEKVDEASRESMDASDPPSYMPIHPGKPKRKAGNRTQK